MSDTVAGKWNSGSGSSGRVLVLTIEPENDLLQGIEAAVEKKKIESGIVISAVGSLKKAVLRNVKKFPDHLPITDEDRLYKTFEGPLEILSLSGNISHQEGQTIVHGHITVSRVKGNEVEVLGGHLVEGCITYVKVEIAVLEAKVAMKRTWNPERKTWELDFKHNPERESS